MIIGTLIAGCLELDWLRIKNTFPGMDDYKSIQAEIDAESGQSKTATKLGGVLQ